jgi:hypothetical protein
MGHTDPTYVVFDGDKDDWAYRFMRGWKASEHIDFDFRDAHDLDNMTGLAQSEAYVKQNLRERMRKSGALIVLVGESTKNLYRFVRWEIDLAIELDLPIIVVNLNKTNGIDDDRCPPLLRNRAALHVSFKMRAIKAALDGWPGQYSKLDYEKKSNGGSYSYSVDQLRNFGVDV